jgi:hypothetical protein
VERNGGAVIAFLCSGEEEMEARQQKGWFFIFLVRSRLGLCNPETRDNPIKAACSNHQVLDLSASMARCILLVIFSGSFSTTSDVQQKTGD